VPESAGRLRFQPVLRSLLAEGLTVRFEAGGRSMLPTIHDGDTLVVAPVDPASIERGDVIVVEGPTCVRAHRVVGEENGGDPTLLLRGDAQRLMDAPVCPDRVLGRVVGLERRGARRPLRGPIVQARVFLRRSLMAVRGCFPDPRLWVAEAGCGKGHSVDHQDMSSNRFRKGRTGRRWYSRRSQ